MVDSRTMENNTAQQILDVAQEKVRSRGYSAFSYADIAEQVGIRKASIHYHFPTKEKLVLELVRRYGERMIRTSDRISQSPLSPQQKLIKFAALYQNGLDQDQICLCSMLTADFSVLSSEIKAELNRYFQTIQSWLADLLRQGYGLDLETADLEAQGLIALFQGAQLMARTSENGMTDFEHLVYPLLKRKFPDR